MFIRKSQYRALMDQLNELKQENEQLERKLTELVNENIELEKKLKQKHMDNLVELLDSEEYKYAILVKDLFPVVYNDGRIEKGIRSVTFEANCSEIPRITIEK